MKTHVRNLFFTILMLSVVACGGDDNDDPTPADDQDLGVFAGAIQVSDDPQTDLGYILNAKVSVTQSGTTATVKVTGEPGFSREYTGTITSVAGTHDIKLTKQTKPVEKNAGDRVLIANNKLTLMIDIANDKVSVRDSPTTSAIFDITGKIQMIGTDMLEE
jgi:hypothetical protein